LYLRRGHIILIGGGTAAAISFAAFMYLLADNTYTVQPNDQLMLRQSISNGSQGVYSISFPLFEGQSNIKILDTSNKTVIEDTISPPVANEVFPVAESGYYTLILTNPSQDAAIEATILFGDQSSFVAQTAFSFLLYGGIIAAIAGAAITILDRMRTSRMKQFGDTSDLV